MECVGLVPLPGKNRPKAFTMDFYNQHLWTYGGYGDGSQQLCVLRNFKIDSDEYGDWERIYIKDAESRAAHVSFILNGKLYVHGGYGSYKESVTQFKAFSTLESIDFETQKCTKLKYTKVVPNVERRWHCGFVCENKFYIHGGWNDGGPVPDLTCLDLSNMAWETTTLPDAPPARRWHSLTQISNTKKYILFGGYHGDYTDTFADTHVLNLENGSWAKPELRGDLPPPRINHTFEEIGSKSLFLLGGRDIRKETCQDSYVLTLDNMKWNKIKNAGELFCINRSGHKAVRVGEHGLVVAGGNNPKYIDPFYYMDIRMLEW